MIDRLININSLSFIGHEGGVACKLPLKLMFGHIGRGVLQRYVRNVNGMQWNIYYRISG